MQADDFEPRIGRLPPHVITLGRRNLGGVLGDGERCDLDPRVPTLGAELKTRLDRAVVEGLVADGEFHGPPGFRLWKRKLWVSFAFRQLFHKYWNCGRPLVYFWHRW